MKKFAIATILSVVSITSAQAELTKSAGGDITFKAKTGSIITFTAAREAIVNNQSLGQCTTGQIFKNTVGSATVKRVGDAVKIMDGTGNELRIAGGAVKGLNADGEYDAVLTAATSAIVAPTVAVTYDYNTVVKDLGAKKVGNNLILNMSSDVLFNFGKADITPAAEKSLGELAYVINQDRKGKVLIQGHTDSVGGDPENIALSQSRANNVAAWLMTNAGLNQSVIQVQGLGESYPVAANANPDGSDNPQGRALNRRVAILVQTVDEPLKVNGAVDSVIQSGNQTVIQQGGNTTIIENGGGVTHIQTDAAGNTVLDGPSGNIQVDQYGNSIVTDSQGNTVIAPAPAPAPAGSPAAAPGGLGALGGLGELKKLESLKALGR